MQGKERYLELISKYVKIHGTVYTEQEDHLSAVVPSFVMNHGLLKGPDLQQLLRESKVCTGYYFIHFWYTSDSCYKFTVVKKGTFV